MATTVCCSSNDNSSHKLEVAEMGVVTFLFFFVSFVPSGSFFFLLGLVTA